MFCTLIALLGPVKIWRVTYTDLVLSRNQTKFRHVPARKLGHVTDRRPCCVGRIEHLGHTKMSASPLP